MSDHARAINRTCRYAEAARDALQVANAFIRAASNEAEENVHYQGPMADHTAAHKLIKALEKARANNLENEEAIRKASFETFMSAHGEKDSANYYNIDLSLNAHAMFKYYVEQGEGGHPMPFIIQKDEDGKETKVEI